MTIPIGNVYYLLCYAWGFLDQADVVEVAELNRLERVQDLFGSVLAQGTFRLLRRGIDQGYREFTREMPGVRGKLEVGLTAKRALRARGRTVCTVEEFSPDVLHNRIVRSTLQALLRTEGLDPEVRRSVALAFRKMDGVTVVPLRRGLFRRVQLDRNQRTYRFLLAICRLVADSLLLREGRGEGRFQDFRRDQKRMWQLFEEFVSEFLHREQSLFRIEPQRRLAWAAPAGATPRDEALIPAMFPDLVAEAPHRRVILDAKFYRSPLRSGRGGPKLRSGNLYQILTYLQNRQGTHPEGPRHEGILLYAAVGETLRVDVRLQGFRVQARTVDLSRPWEEIHGELLSVLVE